MPLMTAELPRYDTIARAFLPRSEVTSEDGTAPVEETMTKTNQQTDNQARRPQATEPAQASEPTNLSFLYGSIGIQAVAAAARYSDVRKKPAISDAILRIDQRFVESAG